MLQTKVESRGWPWPPIEQLIDAVDSIEEIQALIADPSAFMERAKAAVLAALVAKAKSMLQTKVESRGWPWPPVEQLVDEVDSMEEVEALIADPSAFMERAKAVVTTVEAEAASSSQGSAHSRWRSSRLRMAVMQGQLQSSSTPQAEAATSSQGSAHSRWRSSRLCMAVMQGQLQQSSSTPQAEESTRQHSQLLARARWRSLRPPIAVMQRQLHSSRIPPVQETARRHPHLPGARERWHSSFWTLTATKGTRQRASLFKAEQQSKA